MRRRVTAGLAAALLAPALLAGCANTVGGTAMKSGTGPARGDNSADKYPNLLKECDVLTSDVLAKTVGADPLDIQSTFVGAVCRWQALNPAGLIDITRFWFEQGSLDNERKTAEASSTRSRAGPSTASRRSSCGPTIPTGPAVWPVTPPGWWAGGSTRRPRVSTRAVRRSN